MNERILKLAEEHGFIHEYMSIGERNDALTKYREFAELIVQDVMNLFGDEILSLHYLEQGCCQDSVTLLKSKVKEHFGVEE